MLICVVAQVCIAACASAAPHRCAIAAELAGADYDITRSKFAFGSAPVKMPAGALTRWVGTQGVIAIDESGYTLGVMNAGAAESAVGDWSTDVGALADHAIGYFVTMGIVDCQIAYAKGTSSGLSRTIELVRVVDEIVVAESQAHARFNAHDLTTEEGFYWPAISKQVVAETRAFRQQLADPAGLASFKAKLPAQAQGEGSLVLHHSSGTGAGAFVAVPTYDVISGRSRLSFSREGEAVDLPQ